MINIKEKRRIVETLRSTNNIDIYNINDYITRIPSLYHHNFVYDKIRIIQKRKKEKIVKLYTIYYIKNYIINKCQHVQQRLYHINHPLLYN